MKNDAKYENLRKNTRHEERNDKQLKVNEKHAQHMNEMVKGMEKRWKLLKHGGSWEGPGTGGLRDRRTTSVLGTTVSPNKNTIQIFYGVGSTAPK